MRLSERIAASEGELLGSLEVASLLEVAPSTLQKWQAEGLVPRPIAIGRYRRWNKDDLVAWAQAKEEGR